jgi:hypothetical protein
MRQLNRLTNTSTVVLVWTSALNGLIRVKVATAALFDLVEVFEYRGNVGTGWIKVVYPITVMRSIMSTIAAV